MNTVDKIKLNEELMKLVKIVLPNLYEVRRLASENKEMGFDLQLEDFFQFMATIHPQSYGSRIENKLSYDLGLHQSNDKDRGDKMSTNGRYFEFKGSIITSSNTKLHLVQIRPWQDVYYIFYCCDIRDSNNIKLQYFLLDRSQMESECIGATPCHGTKEANLLNINKELSVRFKINSDKYVQWVKNYGISLENLKKNINE